MVWWWVLLGIWAVMLCVWLTVGLQAIGGEKNSAQIVGVWMAFLIRVATLIPVFAWSWLYLRG